MLTPAHDRTGIDVTLAAGGVRLAGIVRDVAGGVIEGATVRAESSRTARLGGAPAFGPSDEHGRFVVWVAAGEVEVDATAPGYARGHRRYRAPTELAELVLLPESVLVGRVVDASSGAPVADAEVWPGQHRAFRYDRGPELDGPLVRTDADGRFRIDGLVPGLYAPGAVAQNRYGKAPELVHLGLGETSTPIEIRVHPSLEVRGRVVIADTDAPCPEPELTLHGLAGPVRGRSLAAGEVEVLGLVAGHYEVDVDCPGYVSADEYPSVTLESSSVSELVWRVTPGASVRGEVVDAQGRALANMGIHGHTLAGTPVQLLPPATALTDALGRFTVLGVAPGRYTITAGGPAGTSEPVEIELASTDDAAEIQLVVADGGILRGRVVDIRGAAVPQRLVAVERTDVRSSRRVVSGDDGIFELRGLASGPYRAWAVDDERALLMPSAEPDPASVVVDIRAGELSEIVLTVPAADGQIRGRVLDPTGAPVPDAFVSALPMVDVDRQSLARQRANALARLDWSSLADPTLTDFDGRFTLSGLAAGEYIVHAHRRGGEAALTDRVSPGDDIVLELEAGGSIGGVVTDARGQAPPRFEVTLRGPELGLVRRDALVHTDGQWRIAELPAGSYEIRVEAPEGSALASVELDPGETKQNVALVLDPRVELVGRVVDLASGEPLSRIEVTVSGELGAGPSPNGSDVTDAQGRFRVVAPIGEVRLHVGPDGGTAGSVYEFLWMFRRVEPAPAVQDIGDLELLAKRLGDGERPGDLGFDLAPTEPSLAADERRATVARVRPGGPADVAGLRVGDVIVAVDGVSVVGRDLDRLEVLLGVRAGTVLVLTLMDGRTVEVLAG